MILKSGDPVKCPVCDADIEDVTPEDELTFVCPGCSNVIEFLTEDDGKTFSVYPVSDDDDDDDDGLFDEEEEEDEAVEEAIGQGSLLDDIIGEH